MVDCISFGCYSRLILCVEHICVYIHVMTENDSPGCAQHTHTHGTRYTSPEEHTQARTEKQPETESLGRDLRLWWFRDTKNGRPPNDRKYFSAKQEVQRSERSVEDTEDETRIRHGTIRGPKESAVYSFPPNRGAIHNNNIDNNNDSMWDIIKLYCFGRESEEYVNYKCTIICVVCMYTCANVQIYYVQQINIFFGVAHTRTATRRNTDTDTQPAE